jgi:hypothetical protein
LTRGGFGLSPEPEQQANNGNSQISQCSATPPSPHKMLQIQQKKIGGGKGSSLCSVTAHSPPRTGQIRSLNRVRGPPPPRSHIFQLHDTRTTQNPRDIRGRGGRRVSPRSAAHLRCCVAFFSEPHPITLIPPPAEYIHTYIDSSQLQWEEEVPLRLAASTCAAWRRQPIIPSSSSPGPPPRIGIARKPRWERDLLRSEQCPGGGAARTATAPQSRA